MGDEYDRMEALADEYSAGLPADSPNRKREALEASLGRLNTYPRHDGATYYATAADEAEDLLLDMATPLDAIEPPLPAFHLPFKLPATVEAPAAETVDDPMRPKVVRGRYPLPHPDTGKARTWQRVSNFIKLAEDTYNLELWKQRNVAKGLAMRPDYVEAVTHMDVKQDKERLNKICSAAQDIAGAYKMSDEGTALHKSCELAENADGSLEPVPDHHRDKVRLYLDALMAHGLSVVPGMVERVTVSDRYQVAGTFDNILRLSDGSYVIGDKKTGSDLDLSMPSISGQLACYQDGINAHGVWDGTRYDKSIRVDDKYGYVIHLPSDRDEVMVYRVSLAAGHELLAVCLTVREQRKVKAKHVSRVFPPEQRGDVTDAMWLELLNAAHTVDEMKDVAARARRFGQWTERLAGQARLLAGELAQAQAGMGS